MSDRLSSSIGAAFFALCAAQGAMAQTFQRLADARELVFAPHFPYPGIGRIEKAKDGFAWKPALPAGK